MRRKDKDAELVVIPNGAYNMSCWTCTQGREIRYCFSCDRCGELVTAYVRRRIRFQLHNIKCHVCLVKIEASLTTTLDSGCECPIVCR